jgi:hypothetical protein
MIFSIAAPVSFLPKEVFTSITMRADSGHTTSIAASE